ncbi:MAG: FkbM family methyltransferase [Acidobacteria bacterium]|nr:FkbM family methyltransferase [Acidobacteriota bacterium]
MHRRDFVVGAVTGAAAASATLVTGRAVYARFRDDGRASFSEQGEDLVLFHVVRDVLKVAHPTYVDVGAAHPVESNNTYLLYTHGGRGVLVEPNPVFAEQLRDKRPRDTVVEAGIGVAGAAEADYYVIRGNPMLNTFSREQVDELRRRGGDEVVERVVKMPLITLDQLMAEHLGRAPDVLSTDVEGLDFAILRSLDFERFRPGAICAEGASTDVHGRQSPIAAFLLTKGYVPRGGSLVNTIYVSVGVRS